MNFDERDTYNRIQFLTDGMPIACSIRYDVTDPVVTNYFEVFNIGPFYDKHVVNVRMYSVYHSDKGKYKTLKTYQFYK